MVLYEAMKQCKVRGYIYRKSNPSIHFGKNGYDFEYIITEWQVADDWETHDPQEDESFAETA